MALGLHIGLWLSDYTVGCHKGLTAKISKHLFSRVSRQNQHICADFVCVTQPLVFCFIHTSAHILLCKKWCFKIVYIK